MTFREGEGTPLEASSPAFFLFFPRLYKQPQPQRPRTVTCTQENCNRMAIFKNNVFGKGVLLLFIPSLAIPILRLALLHHLQNPFFCSSPQAPPREWQPSAAQTLQKARLIKIVQFLFSLPFVHHRALQQMQLGHTCSKAPPPAALQLLQHRGLSPKGLEYLEYLRSTLST